MLIILENRGKRCLMDSHYRTSDWPVSVAQANVIQERLAKLVVREGELPELQTVAGIDVGFDDRLTARAAVAVLSFPDLTLCDYAIHRQEVAFPYVPGYLSFRECPVILGALDKLRSDPQVLLCDGQGIAHPRRFGLASHLGVLTAKPTIGVAKSRLIGEHGEVPHKKGQWVELIDRANGSGDNADGTKKETIGAVLRTRENVKPLYISVGHRLSLASSLALVMRLVTRFRLPETTRWADGLASNRPARWLQDGLIAYEHLSP
jgi:deoxyribonuclease V